MSTPTYTLVFAGDMLIATVPTGGDIDAAVAAEEDRARAEFTDVRTVGPVTLTDDAPEDDRAVVHSGSDMGWLIDERGRAFVYAVRA